MTNPTRELAEQLLHELKANNRLQTEHWAKASSQVINGCLEVATDVLDGNGILARSFHATCGSVVITNTTGALLIVAAGPPAAGGAPARGKGITQVPANFAMTIPIGDVAFTLYGTAGTTVSLQAWTGLQPFGIVV